MGNGEDGDGNRGNVADGGDGGGAVWTLDCGPNDQKSKHRSLFVTMGAMIRGGSLRPDAEQQTKQKKNKVFNFLVNKKLKQN